MSATKEEREVTWEDRYWSSQEGLRLHYRDYSGSGDKPPVICLHGLTRNARDFAKLAQRLKGTQRVIVPDFRGRGLSAWDPVRARYAPPTYARDVLDLMGVLKIDCAVFIGTSLGGLVTMAIAAIDQGRIAASVLNDVGPALEPAGLERIRSYVAQAQWFGTWEEAARAIQRRDETIHPRYQQKDWLAMAHRLCRRDGSQIRFDYDIAIAHNVVASAGAPAMNAWPYWEGLYHAPAVIIRGALSDLLSREAATKMAAEHPDCELIEIDGVGHAPDLDEPHALAGIARLLRKARNVPCCEDLTQ